METPDNCRICCEQGQYDIFSDELSFDVSNNIKIKIYIVLNNFLFEKLYAADEFSSLICHSCCNNLCDSYTFMTQVRKCEQNQRSGATHRRQESTKTILAPATVQVPAQYEEATEDTSIEEVTEEDHFALADDVSETEEDLKVLTLAKLEPKLEPLIDIKPVVKKAKIAVTTCGLPESITYTHYELLQYVENNQNVFVINVSPRTLERPLNSSYFFDTSWISNEDTTSVYKCKHCVKAFSNSAFLVKHSCNSHLCLICMGVVDNYKDLSKHSKDVHSLIKCNFCCKPCGSSANYRQHLKKQHLLNLPNHVGILSD